VTVLKLLMLFNHLKESDRSRCHVIALSQDMGVKIARQVS